MFERDVHINLSFKALDLVKSLAWTGLKATVWQQQVSDNFIKIAKM